MLNNGRKSYVNLIYHQLLPELTGAVNMHKLDPEKGFKFPIEMLSLSELQIENAFTPEFLNLLRELDTEMVGLTFGVGDSVVTIGSDLKKEGFFFSMPAVDDEIKKKIFKFFKVEISKEDDEDEKENVLNE